MVTWCALPLTCVGLSGKVGVLCAQVGPGKANAESAHGLCHLPLHLRIRGLGKEHWHHLEPSSEREGKC